MFNSMQHTANNKGRRVNFIHRTESLPYRPTKAWLWTNADHGPEDWEVRLDKPKPAEGGESRPVQGFKAQLLGSDFDATTNWAVQNGKKVRFVRPRMVFERYLTALRERIEHSASADYRPWVLLPAIRDDAARRRYKQAILSALPNSGLLSEPEMVLEYFRLIQGNLPLIPDRNNVFLVIDVGAATCNLTFVQSNRSGQIVRDRSGSGDQRDLRLRPVYSDSVLVAGRWVDEQIAAQVGLSVPRSEPKRTESLNHIEQIKIDVAEKERPRGIRGVRRQLTVEDLEDIAEALWDKLYPLYTAAAQEQYENLLSTEEARRLNQDELGRLDIRSGQHLHKRIDAVILAGGTTRLPGFKDAMRRKIFGDQQPPEILEVGNAYAIAAATGALAHVLHQNQPDGQPRLSTPTPQAIFKGALPFDLTVGWRPAKKKGIKAGEEVVLEAADPKLTKDIHMSVTRWPPPPPKTAVELSLYLANQPRNQRHWRPALVEGANSTLSALWEQDHQHARLDSQGIPQARAVFLDVAKAMPRRSARRGQQSTSSGPVRTEATPDIIVDLGMSKTVVLGAQAGTLDGEAFEESGGMRGFTPDPVPSEPPAASPPAASPPAASPPAASPPAASPPAASPPAASPQQTDPEEPQSQPSPTPPPSADRVPENPEPWPAIRAALADLNNENDRHRLYFALLAVLTRSVVLFSGPPGAGKSTLVRTLARLLGLERESGFHEIPVLPHWREPPQRLIQLHTGLILLDEFNLAQPERYAWELLNRAHSPGDDLGLLVCGTLNIDMASRPPSPKVFDRAFLVEVDAPSSAEPTAPPEIQALRPAWGLWSAPLEQTTTSESLAKVINTIQHTVREKSLRADLLPSHRALHDTRQILAWHETLTKLSDGEPLMQTQQVVDRVVASRLLTRISGPDEQVRPLLDALKTVVKGGRWSRSHRRIEVLNAQLRALGFCSPWQ